MKSVRVAIGCVLGVLLVATTASAQAGPTLVTFNDLSNPNRPLNGAYPTGVINWGTNAWYLASPWQQFSTNSIGFNGSGPTSATFAFVTPSQVIEFDAVTEGSTSTVTITCGSTYTRSVSPGSVVHSVTGLSGTCSTVTVTSSNGWNTNFDNFLVGTSSAPTATPTPTPTATPGAPQNTPTPTATPTTVSGSGTVTFDVPPFAQFNGSNVPPQWNDTAGQQINAVSPGVFRVGSTWYMVGLAVAGASNQPSDYTFSAGLNCYSSPDLRNWTQQNAGNVLTPTSASVAYATGSVLGATRYVFRTHVAYNEATHKYVLWGKSSDSPGWANQTYVRATADAPCGPYSLVTSGASLPSASFDDNYFYVDPNSTETPKAAYVIYAGGSTDRSTHVVKLDSTYLAAATPAANVTIGWQFSCGGTCDNTAVTPMEGHAVFYRAPYYYLTGSDITGWAPNDNYALMATSMLGPWRRSTDGSTHYLAPQTTKTCHSQSGEIVGPVGPSNVYMSWFDRWFDGARGATDAPFPVPAPVMGYSRLIVQPFTFDTNGVASMACVSQWSLDTGGSTTPTATPTSTQTPQPTSTPTPIPSTATPLPCRVWVSLNGGPGEWKPCPLDWTF